MYKRMETCRGCGAPVAIIKCTTRKCVMVDAETVWITWDAAGDLYYSMDGAPVVGWAVGDAWDGKAMEAYRPHRPYCPTGGKKPRERRPR